MNKKKLLMPLSIALAFLTIVLASCGGKNDDNDKTVTSNDTTTVESSTATDTSTNTSTSTQTSTSTETSTSTSTSTSTQTSTSTETSTSTQTSTSTDTTTSTDITTSTSTSSNTSTSSSQPTPTTTSDDPGVQKFNITYLDKNNNPIDDIGDNPTTISENDGIVVFNNISKTGYTFDGFYTDKQLTNKITQIDSSTIAEDFALYVSFTAIRYNVTFDAGIGTNPNTFTTYSIESDTITLLDATVSEGYTFDGWYDSNNQKVTQIVHGSTGDITLTAI